MSIYICKENHWQFCVHDPGHNYTTFSAEKFFPTFDSVTVGLSVKVVILKQNQTQ